MTSTKLNWKASAFVPSFQSPEAKLIPPTTPVFGASPPSTPSNLASPSRLISKLNAKAAAFTPPPSVTNSAQEKIQTPLAFSAPPPFALPPASISKPADSTDVSKKVEVKPDEDHQRVASDPKKDSAKTDGGPPGSSGVRATEPPKRTEETPSPSPVDNKKDIVEPRRGRSRTSSAAETRAAEVEAEKSLEKTTRDTLEEKIRKSREYLLSLRFAPASQVVPEALVGHPMLHGAAKPADGWSPRSRKTNGASKGGPQSPRRGGPRKGRGGRVETPIPLLRVEPLVKSENRYQIVRDLNEDTKTMRTLQSIMNKVTPEKFETLLKKASELKIDSPDMLKGAVSVVFEKALAEPNFSPTYAEFCRRLAPSLPSLTVDGVTFSFRKMLLNQCQAEFEGKHAAESNKDLSTMSEEVQMAATLSKRRMLGTIRFIGELFVRKVLAAGVMRNCIHLLLRDSAMEENIEALCDLLKTVGKELDKLESTTDKTKSDAKDSNFMEALFVQLAQLVEPKDKMSSRLRFMIKDVLDLRRDDWVARRQQAVAQKLSEIRKETTTPAAKKGGKATPKEEAKPSAASKAKDRYAVRDSKTTPKKTGKASDKVSPDKVDDEWETIPSSRNARNPKAKRPEARPEATARKPKDTDSVSGTASPVKPKKGKDTKDKAQAAAPVVVKSKNIYDLGDDEDVEAEPQEEEAEENDEYEQIPEEEDDDDAEEKSSSKSGKKLSERDVDNRIKALISEYFTAQDKQEACLCVEELKSKQHHRIVYLGLNLIMELKDRERTLLRDLFLHFYEKKILTEETFVQGFGDSLSTIEDVSIDVPQAPIYVAKIMASVIIAGALRLSILTSEPAQSLKDSGKLSMLAISLLKEIESLKGEATMMALWNHSSLDFNDLVQPESSDVAALLEKHGLSACLR